MGKSGEFKRGRGMRSKGGERLEVVKGWRFLGGKDGEGGGSLLLSE